MEETKAKDLEQSQRDHREFVMRQNERRREYRNRLESDARKNEFERKVHLKDHSEGDVGDMDGRRGLARQRKYFGRKQNKR